MSIRPDNFSHEPTVVPVPSPLQAVREEWETIYEELPVRSPFLSFDYLCLWYHCFAEVEAIRVIRVESQGETVGFLPLVLSRRAGLRVLKSITNAHCFHCSPLIRLNREYQFGQCLFPTLHGDQSSWDILELSCFFSFRPDFDIVSQERLAASGFKNRRHEQPNFTIDLHGTFDEYFQRELSSSLRRDLKKRFRLLENSGPVAFPHYQKEEAVAYFPEFLEIEGSGWKNRANSSILNQPENYHRYYQNLVRLLARRDDLHLFFLNQSGKSIAAALGYTEGEVYHSFKSGYREEYHHLAPSNLLRLNDIKYFLQNRPDIKKFHLFPVDGGFKHRWANEDSTTVDIALFSRSLRGQLSYSMHLARKRLKSISWLRRAVQGFRAAK